MPKYKVGDKVVLRRDLTSRDSFVLSNGAVVSVNHEMIDFANEGLFATIKTVEHDMYYSFDGCDYLWVDEMIAKLYPESKTHEFQVGERVKCIDATDAEDFLELNQYYEVVELFPIDGFNPPIIVIRLNDYENEQFYAHRFVHYDTSAVDTVAKVVDNVIDMVHHPSHYTAGGIETLDYIKAKLNVLKDLTPFQSYCWGNVIKYLSRLGLKGNMDEDLDKAITYLTAMKGDSK